MKKSEIEIGVLYFVNNHNDWANSPWGQKRMRVLDTTIQKWKKLPDGTWGKTNQSFGGYTSGVLAEQLDELGKVVWTGAITLTSIRGEWEPTSKAFEERLATARAVEREVKQKQLLLQLAVGTAVAKAQQMGIPGVQTGVSGRKIEIDPKVFAAMLAHLDREAWTYNPNAEGN